MSARLPGEHTGTFRGNQLAMVSGAKALEIKAERDNLVEHANVAGQDLRLGLEGIQRRCQLLIADVRGKGFDVGCV